jgi:hypothetical protein
LRLAAWMFPLMASRSPFEIPLAMDRKISSALPMIVRAALIIGLRPEVSTHACHLFRNFRALVTLGHWNRSCKIQPYLPGLHRVEIGGFRLDERSLTSADLEIPRRLNPCAADG